MTNFKLQTGDWIPTCEVPVDKRQKVIDAFVEAGADNDPDNDKDIDPIVPKDFSCWGHVGWIGCYLDLFHDEPSLEQIIDRRVNIEQILGDGNDSTVEVPKEPTSEMINAMFDAMRKLEDEEYPGHMAKYSVNDMLHHVWIAGVNAAKVGRDD